MRTYTFSEIKAQIEAFTGGKFMAISPRIEKAVFYIDFNNFLEILEENQESSENVVQAFFSLNPYVLNPDVVPVFKAGCFYMFRLIKEDGFFARSELVAELIEFPSPDSDVFTMEDQRLLTNLNQIQLVQMVVIPGSEVDKHQVLPCGLLLDIPTRSIFAEYRLFPIEEITQTH